MNNCEDRKKINRILQKINMRFSSQLKEKPQSNKKISPTPCVKAYNSYEILVYTIPILWLYKIYNKNKPKNAINGMNLICPINPSPPLPKFPTFHSYQKGKKKIPSA